ncbi:hypothetical protein CEXT_786951 [Caerostris extrusa]|uniref:Uncharacterized protein n=1 Tax=Caerostris extrusa TaxID=172846 RepID=A0AAV4QJT8_CAEEX|nr:hypothetical protein CEXT_786951 [Caerostris extrusa]
MNSFAHGKEVSPQRELLVYIIMFMRGWMCLHLVTRISDSAMQKGSRDIHNENDYFVRVSSDLSEKECKFFFVGTELLWRAQRAAARKMNSFAHRKEVSPQRELLIYIIMFMRDWTYAFFVTRISASAMQKRSRDIHNENDYFVRVFSDLSEKECKWRCFAEGSKSCCEENEFFAHRKEVSPQRELLIYIIMFMRGCMYALLVTRISASAMQKGSRDIHNKNDYFHPVSLTCAEKECKVRLIVGFVYKLIKQWLNLICSPIVTLAELKLRIAQHIDNAVTYSLQSVVEHVVSRFQRGQKMVGIILNIT